MPDLLDRIRAILTPEELARLIGAAIPPVPTPAPPATTPSPPVGSTTPIRIPSASHEYSTMNPWNVNMKGLLLLHPSGRVGLHYGDTGQFHMILPGVTHSSEPRWSESPNVFYYIVDNHLMRFDVGKDWSSNARQVMRTFSEYSKISGKGESDISPTNNTFVFIGDDHDVFTYRISSDRKSPTYDWLPELDSLYITDQRVLISSPTAGIYAFDHDMHPLHKVAPVNGHMDVCVDNGKEWLIWINAADDTGENRNAALAGCANGVVKIDLSIPLGEPKQQSCLLSLDWSLAAHISGVDHKGFVLVSTYAPDSSKPKTPYTNKVLKVRLDNSGADVLQELGDGPFNSYELTPKASISRDGSRFIYDLNGDAYIGRL